MNIPVAQILAMEADSRPGVARLAMEALSAITGEPLPERHHELVRRRRGPRGSEK